MIQINKTFRRQFVSAPRTKRAISCFYQDILIISSAYKAHIEDVFKYIYTGRDRNATVRIKK